MDGIGLNEKINIVYSYLKSLREKTDELNRVSQNEHEGPEIVIPAQPLDLVLKSVVHYMAKSKAFVNGNKPNVGDFKRSYGYNKVIGVQSLDGKVSTRIDFNPSKGYHYHFEDYRKKPINYCFLISDMNEKTYEKYIDTLTKRHPITVKEEEVKEDSLEVLFYKKYKVNVGLIKAMRNVYPYEFLDTINPKDELKAEPFELMCAVELLIQKEGVSPKYRVFLNEYLKQAGMGATKGNYIGFLSFFKKYVSSRDEEVFKKSL